MKPFSDLRLLISGLCALLLALCLPAQAQPGENVPRIGYLHFRVGPNAADEAFRQALRGLGWIDGQNMIIEYRWAAGKQDRYPALAEELVRLKVDLIVTRPSRSARQSRQTCWQERTGS
jgi:putative ABC transport system substrate-binding protein